MTSRICMILICLIALAGCYTQIRPPRVQQERRPESGVPPSADSAQRFEYYYRNYCDPFAWRPSPYYELYLYSPYLRYPSWGGHRLIWQYSRWATAYDPWWQGWQPHILAHHLAHTPAVRPHGTSRREQPNPRPRIRYTGVRGEPASASAVRAGSTTTRTTQKTGNSGSTKTQPTSEKSKEKSKSEKREEKREGQRRRGGMR